MIIDAYTRAVLTLIAACLAILTVNNLGLFPEARAKTPGNFITPIPSYGLVPLNKDGSINVKLSASDELDVNIVGVNTYDELEVDIVEVGGGYVSHGGPILVDVD